MATRLTPRYADALQYAIDAHGDQRRKASDVTYLTHLLAVSSLVLEFGGGEDEAIAALLHDVVEDCGVNCLFAHRKASTQEQNRQLSIYMLYAKVLMLFVSAFLMLSF